MMDKKKLRRWIPLDTVARIYPSLVGSRSPTSFRISVLLREPVNPLYLREAAADVTHNLPYFQYCLRRGLFWHFLEKIEKLPLVVKDSGHILKDFYGIGNERLLLRILYGERRVSVECSHILTDGHGAMVYLKKLIEQYLIRAGILHRNNVSESDFSDWEYMEDSYQRYFLRDVPYAGQQSKAYQFKADLLPDHRIQFICGEINSDSLQKETRKWDVTISQYLAAAYLWSLYSVSKKEKKRPVQIIRLMIPVNLRNLYPSKTIRNFFIPTFCEIMPFLGEYRWEEILEEVKLQMIHEIKRRFINLQIARYVAITNNIFIKLIPLLLKEPVQRFIYFNSGIRTTSGILSNLGRVIFPSEIEKHIERMEFITSPSHLLKTTAGVICCKDRVLVIFCNTTANREIEREFFTTLSKNGIRIKMNTDYHKE